LKASVSWDYYLLLAARCSLGPDHFDGFASAAGIVDDVGGAACSLQIARLTVGSRSPRRVAMSHVRGWRLGSLGFRRL